MAVVLLNVIPMWNRVEVEAFSEVAGGPQNASKTPVGRCWAPVTLPFTLSGRVPVIQAKNRSLM